jgi:hypothetical protein
METGRESIFQRTVLSVLDLLQDVVHQRLFVVADEVLLDSNLLRHLTNRLR